MRPSAYPPEPLCTHDRGQHPLCLGEKIPAGIVEIVGVLVVAEQDGIDLADRLRTERRSRQLLEFHMRQLIGPGRVEGRIGEQPKAIDLDQGGGAADQGDAK
jgi:hypothetical protein